MKSIDKSVLNYFNAEKFFIVDIINYGGVKNLIQKIDDIKNHVDYIFISSSDETIDTEKPSTNIIFHPQKDAVKGDIFCINNPTIDKMIYSIITNEKYEAVNTLGYVKKIISPIAFNYYLIDGGIFVKNIIQTSSEDKNHTKCNKITITFNSIKKLDNLLYNFQNFDVVFSKYNTQFRHYISLGDHCAVGMSLNELKIRTWSFPFDWIITNFYLISKYTKSLLNIKSLHKEDASSQDRIEIIKNFMRNENIEFPHDTGTHDEILEKYIRRFQRYIDYIQNGDKILFIFATRFDEIKKEEILEFIETVKGYNSENKMLYITGVERRDLENIPDLIYKLIPYDKSKYFEFDYTDFRPAITSTIKNLL